LSFIIYHSLLVRGTWDPSLSSAGSHQTCSVVYVFAFSAMVVFGQ